MAGPVAVTSAGGIRDVARAAAADAAHTVAAAAAVRAGAHWAEGGRTAQAAVGTP